MDGTSSNVPDSSYCLSAERTSALRKARFSASGVWMKSAVRWVLTMIWISAGATLRFMEVDRRIIETGQDAIVRV